MGLVPAVAPEDRPQRRTGVADEYGGARVSGHAILGHRVEPAPAHEAGRGEDIGDVVETDGGGGARSARRAPAGHLGVAEAARDLMNWNSRRRTLTSAMRK